MTYFTRWSLGFPIKLPLFLQISDKKLNFYLPEFKIMYDIRTKQKKIIFFSHTKNLCSYGYMYSFHYPRHKEILDLALTCLLDYRVSMKFLTRCIYFKGLKFIFRNTLTIGKCLNCVQIHLCKNFYHEPTAKMYI